jgi:hypothetical protein
MISPEILTNFFENRVPQVRLKKQLKCIDAKAFNLGFSPINSTEELQSISHALKYTSTLIENNLKNKPTLPEMIEVSSDKPLQNMREIKIPLPTTESFDVENYILFNHVKYNRPDDGYVLATDKYTINHFRIVEGDPLYSYGLSRIYIIIVNPLFAWGDSASHLHLNNFSPIRGIEWKTLLNHLTTIEDALNSYSKA